MSILHRTLDELVAYPPHEPRKASAEYGRIHHDLVVTRDEPCWICGIRHSEGGAMETHHAHLEWAAANGVDPARILADFPEANDLRQWLDSEGNMLVLCAAHHRGQHTGIHAISYPAWLLQRYQEPQRWQFIDQGGVSKPIIVQTLPPSGSSQSYTLT